MGNTARHGVILACGLALVCIPALTGCKSVRKWFAPADAIELNTEETSGSTQSSDRQGLGIQLLVIDDTNYDAPRALRSYPQLRNDRVRESWSRWGFRIVEVPIDDIDPMLDSFRPVQPVSVQFMGEFGQWRPLVRSGAIRQSIVRVGESSREIAPGRPMLIARSWTEPTLVDEGVQRLVRLDLGMQIESQSDSFALLPSTENKSLDDRGLVIDELLSSLVIDDRNALVIVGEVPGEDWESLPAPIELGIIEQENNEIGPEEEPEAGEQIETESPDRPAPRSSRTTMMPEPPRTRSLGELMLVAPGSRIVRANETRTIPKRVVIVLIPELRSDVLTPPSIGSAEGAEN